MLFQINPVAAYARSKRTKRVHQDIPDNRATATRSRGTDFNEA